LRAGRLARCDDSGRGERYDMRADLAAKNGELGDHFCGGLWNDGGGGDEETTEGWKEIVGCGWWCGSLDVAVMWR